MNINDSASRAQLQTMSGVQMLLKNVSVSGDLRGALFEAEIRQEFSNPTAKHAEVIYSFPLPWGATLLSVEVMLGDKRLSGHVIEKKKAEARYEETLSKGDAAIMLERGEDGHYVLNLGNLAPNENCIVTLRYGQMLRFEQGGLRLLIPTVIAPRYGDLVKDGGLALHQVPESDVLAEYGFAFTLRLHGELAQARVASPSHPIRVGTAAGGVLAVTLGKESMLDRDFILVIDQLAQTSLISVSADYAKPEGFVVAASFKPELGQSTAQPLALKLLVDCSGSMAGDSIKAARRALQEILNRLYEGDKYSLSKFGSEVEHRTRSLWTRTATSVVAAKRWVSQLDADMGGTEMEEALRSTFLLTEDEACDVLLITDGEISAVQGVITAAKASKHRVFVVGIGSSPSEGLIRELAEQTGGACDFVAPGEDVDPAILRMFARLRAPLVRNLSVMWPEGCKPSWTSALGNAVFDGDTLHVFATVTALPTGEVRLLGTICKASLNATSVDTATLSGETLLGTAVFDSLMDGKEVDRTESLDNTLSRLAASVHLQETTDKKKKVRIALDYQLVSPMTNFLMEHVRADGEKATDMPILQKVRQMAPAGHGGLGSVDYGMPSVMRSVSYSMAVPSTMVESAEMIDVNYDIPAFLRRSDDAGTEKLTEQLEFSLPENNKYKARILKGLKDFLGFKKSEQDEFARIIVTPLELKTWLNDHDESKWPEDIVGLIDIGLPMEIVNWLGEINKSLSDDSYKMEQLVKLWFEILALYPLAQHTAGLGTQQEKFLERYYKRYPEREVLDQNSPLGDSEQLLFKAVLEKLVTITSDNWPGAFEVSKAA
jgi:Ca-activated chloride channel family protein